MVGSTHQMRDGQEANTHTHRDRRGTEPLGGSWGEDGKKKRKNGKKTRFKKKDEYDESITITRSKPPT